MSDELKRMQELAGVPVNEEKESLNEHYVAGGIVGVGAVNQIPPREKSDYEMAFEHFMTEGEEKEEKKEISEDEIEEAGGIINFNPSFDYNPTLPGPGIESIDIEDIGVGTGDISNLMTDASTGSPYTTGQDSVLQKHGYDPYEVGTWENQEGLKLLDSLINWNTRA